MQTISRSTFPTVKTEGGLLPADLLQRIADGKVPGIGAGEYHLVGERLNEAITRAWNRCLGAWRSFCEQSARLAENDTGTTLTRERWLLPLFQTLEFGRLPNLRRGIEVDGISYPISHLWGQTPIHLVTFRQELDKRSEVTTALKRTPHSLMQELLNRSPAHQWGIISNGLRLRILRDNATLSRSAFVEFDLEALMSGERYADFALLWLVCHQSRFEPLEGETGRPEDKKQTEDTGANEEEITRTPHSALRTSPCWLETWSKSAADQGTRAMDALREGVQEAIEALGSGFMRHPANATLKGDLQSGKLSTQGYYQQLRRLVYRLIFLFVAEDRDLLLLPATDGATRQRYAEFYALGQVRRLAASTRGSAHPDLYHRVRLLFTLLRTGYPPLGLPGLGSYLFSAAATPDLDGAEIANQDLLSAVRALIFTTENSVRRAVDYRNLDSEELGSIYESLLDLHPVLAVTSASFALRSSAGSERKTTGSHYTPTALVNCLLDSALEPVVAERLAKANDRVTRRQGDKGSAATSVTLSPLHPVTLSEQEKAILSIKVLDPACGSGHMLIGAARRLARHLARVRTGDEEPPPEALRSALREVVRNCIYGVDLNETAVELCKVALWMETLEPGKPLSFLDSHIRCGNSLIGVFNLEDLDEGIPDEAFVALSGDDKASASRIKKRNSQERKQQAQLSLLASLDEGDLVSGFRKLSSQPEETPEEVAQKAAMYETLRSEESWRNEQMACNLWTAAFFAQFSGKALADERIATTGDLRQFLANPQSLDEAKLAYAQERAERHAFFHWCLEFPDVWARGGFDMLISNPPWEHTELKEKEFFAMRHPKIAEAGTGDERKRLIAGLATEDPALYKLYQDTLHDHDSISHFVRYSGRSPLCGRGRVNTYAVFAELTSQLIRDAGRAGIIVPSGIATDDTTKFFFQEIMESQTLVSLYDFENRLAIFPGVHRSYKFCLLTLRGDAPSTPSLTLPQTGEGTFAPDRRGGGAEFVFFALDVADLKDEERRFTLSAAEIALLNPNTRTCPIFRSKRDAELTKAIYRRVPVLIQEAREDEPEQNPWGVSFRQGLFNMTSDSGLFRTRQQLEAEDWRLEGNRFVRGTEVYLPLYEAKMMHQFDHRWATYEGLETRDLTATEKNDPRSLALPRYWVDQQAVTDRLRGYDTEWLVGFRDIARSTDERTAIFGVLPRVGVGHKAPLLFAGSCSSEMAVFFSLLSSFPFDYTARQSVGGTSLSYFPKFCPK